MSDATRLDMAAARAALAKRRLASTVGALQAKLDPRTVARDAVDGIAETGEKALRSGVDAAKRHPGRVAGALALAAALLGRRRIAALIDQPKPEPDESAQPPTVQRVRSLRARPAPARRKP